MRPGRDYAYRKVRERILRNSELCHLCGEPLDFAAPPRSPWAPSVDHIFPVSAMRDADPQAARLLGADASNLQAAHVSCNSKRGAGREPRPHISRSWNVQ
jgi:5-methylcytosine-specific restriction endonuclease McrA